MPVLLGYGCDLAGAVLHVSMPVLCACSKLGMDAPEAALLAAAAVANDAEPRNGARDASESELELDSLMATLMCT